MKTLPPNWSISKKDWMWLCSALDNKDCRECCRYVFVDYDFLHAYATDGKRIHRLHLSSCLEDGYYSRDGKHIKCGQHRYPIIMARRVLACEELSLACEISSININPKFLKRMEHCTQGRTTEDKDRLLIEDGNRTALIMAIRG